MTTQEITGIVGNVFGVHPDDIRQKVRRDRSDRVVFARHAAVSISLALRKTSLIKTAEYFNLGTHASMINAVKKCKNLVDTNRVFAHLFHHAERVCNLSDFERMQFTDFIPFVYSLETSNDE